MFGTLFNKFFGTKGFTKIVTNKAVTVTIPGRPTPFTMSSDHDLFRSLVDALNDRDDERVLELVAVAEKISHATNGEVKLEEGKVTYQGVEQGDIIARKIIQFAAENINPSFLINFLERVKQNPAKYAIDELYLFLKNGNLAIMDDGRFVAYKWVDDNFMDCHTRSFDNSPGKIIEMEREKVDPNRHNTCSRGFHVCTQYYSRFGSRLMLVAVDPADVVSVPSDYNNAKMRVCKYEVLREIDSSEYGGMKEKAFVQYADLKHQPETHAAPEPETAEEETEEQCTYCKAEFGDMEPVEDDDGNELCGEGCLETYNQDDLEEEDEDEEPPLDSPSLDTSFHDNEMNVEEPEGTDTPKIPTGNYQVRFVGNKFGVIPAIKALRRSYDMGLREAKDIVDGPKTFLHGISKGAAEKIQLEMKRQGVSVRVEEQGARKKPKVAKPVEPAKTKAVKKTSKKETSAMDDATWKKFKQAVKNKKSIKGFGLSDDLAKKLREQAKKELNNV